MTLALATIAHNQPWLIREQHRLLEKNLEDDFTLTVFDSSTDEAAAAEIRSASPNYVRLTVTMHHESLNRAAVMLLNGDDPYVGFLDHDVFPTEPTSLSPLIDEAGFYGVGQRHPATGFLYLWPGFCFFKREWLNGRPLNFSGLRDGDPRNDGDTGSMLYPLFQDEDWQKMYRAQHGYKPIRQPDEYGLQSWGVETIGSWVHLSNGSEWMAVPEPDRRRELLQELLAAL